MIDIGWLAEHGPCKKFAAGMSIPCPGGTDASQRAMYMLLAGGVDVFRKSAAGGTQKIASLIKGDIFGGREYFANADVCTYVTSVESVVYVVTEESFNDLSWSRPDILFEIIRAAYMPMRKPAAATKATVQEKAAAAAQDKAAAKVQEKVAAAAQDKAAAKVQEKVAATAQEKAPAKAQPAVTETVKKPADAGVKQSAQAAAPVATPTATHDAAKAETPAAEPATVKAKATVAAPIESTSGFFPAAHKQYPDFESTMNTQLVFPKEYNCPFYKRPFKDFRVFRSKLYENSQMRYDLRKYYTDFQTEWYDVITCHNCMFSTFHNYFTDPKPIQKAKIEKALIAVRAEILLDFSAERDIDYVFTSHYLAILCSDGYPTLGKQIRAKLWGNLSWLYEDVKDEEMEQYAAAKAAEAYEQVYTESRLTPIQEQITCLSIAGMQHRAGIDSNLKRFLFTAKTMLAGDKQYAKLAEDFMYDLKIEDEQ